MITLTHSQAIIDCLNVLFDSKKTITLGDIIRLLDNKNISRTTIGSVIGRLSYTKYVTVVRRGIYQCIKYPIPDWDKLESPCIKNIHESLPKFQLEDHYRTVRANTWGAFAKSLRLAPPTFCVSELNTTFSLSYVRVLCMGLVEMGYLTKYDTFSFKKVPGKDFSKLDEDPNLLNETIDALGARGNLKFKAQDSRLAPAPVLRKFDNIPIFEDIAPFLIAAFSNGKFTSTRAVAYLVKKGVLCIKPDMKISSGMSRSFSQKVLFPFVDKNVNGYTMRVIENSGGYRKYFFEKTSDKISTPILKTQVSSGSIAVSSKPIQPQVPPFETRLSRAESDISSIKISIMQIKATLFDIMGKR